MRSIRHAAGRESCENCGHSRALHDRQGCAAFLGGFPATRDQLQYCACRHREDRDIVLELLPEPSPNVVFATLRVREGRGRGIAVCEVPPALALGSSAREAARHAIGCILDRARWSRALFLLLGPGDPALVEVRSLDVG